MSNEDVTVVETIEVVSEETVIDEKTSTETKVKVDPEFQSLIDHGVLSLKDIEEMDKELDSVNIEEYDLQSAKERNHSALDDSDATVERINSGAMVKSTKSEELLLSINADIESIMDQSKKSRTGSTFKDIIAKIPFGKKVTDDFKKTIARSSTVKQVFDGIFDKLDTQLDHLKSDIADYEQLYDETAKSLKKLVFQKRIIDKKMKSLAQSDEGKTQKGSRELNKWLGMSNEIEGFIFATKTNLDIIHVQLEQTIASESTLTSMKPYLKKQISTQLSLDIKNQKHKSLNQMIGMVRQFTNDISKQTLAAAGENAVQLVKEGQRPLIEKETVKELKKITQKTGQDLKKALSEGSKNALEYRSEMKEVKALENNTGMMSLENEDSSSSIQAHLSREYDKEDQKEAKKVTKKETTTKED